MSMIGEDDKTKQELRGHLGVLKVLGVEKVDVAFSGSGDEGFVNEVIYSPAIPKEMAANFPESDFQDLLYDYLDPARVGDWINNEGGFGEIQIDVATGKVTGNINFNRVEYDTEPLEDKL
jgi:hypothetical protein